MVFDPPSGFPSTLETTELLSFINKCSAELTRGDVHFNSETGVRCRELIDLGINELSRRNQKDLNETLIALKTQTTELKELVSSNAKSSTKLSNISILLTIVTIILAIVTFYSGCQNSKSDEAWKTRQIETLKENNHRLERILLDQNKILINIQQGINVKSIDLKK